MAADNFGLCNGAVYKKVPESMYTYIHFFTVKRYLYQAIKDRTFANQITNHLDKLVLLLSDPDCALIKPIQIDFDYIECLPAGVCFNIPLKKFVRYPYLKGKSPRTFIKDRPKRNPNPIPFIEGRCSMSCFLPNTEGYQTYINRNNYESTACFY